MGLFSNSLAVLSIKKCSRVKCELKQSNLQDNEPKKAANPYKGSKRKESGFFKYRPHLQKVVLPAVELWRVFAPTHRKCMVKELLI